MPRGSIRGKFRRGGNRRSAEKRCGGAGKGGAAQRAFRGNSGGGRGMRASRQSRRKGAGSGLRRTEAAPREPLFVPGGIFSFRADFGAAVSGRPGPRHFFLRRGRSCHRSLRFLAQRRAASAWKRGAVSGFSWENRGGSPFFFSESGGAERFEKTAWFLQKKCRRPLRPRLETGRPRLACRGFS